MSEGNKIVDQPEQILREENPDELAIPDYVMHDFGFPDETRTGAWLRRRWRQTL